MKKLLLSIAAAATLGAAVPAMAQPYGGYDHTPTSNGYGYDRNHDSGGYDRGRGGWGDINQREREIAFRIEGGQRDGTLDWREARILRWQLSQIQSLEQRYRYDGMNGWERADLARRLDRLSFQVRGQRHDQEYGWRYRH